MNWKQSKPTASAAIQFFVYLFIYDFAFVSARSSSGRHQLPHNYDGPRRTHFFDIRNYGAVDDGVTLNSAAFEVRLFSGKDDIAITNLHVWFILFLLDCKHNII
jgi:hypothetical protein